MPQRPLQRRLHLHLPELTDGEVEVLDGLCTGQWLEAVRPSLRPSTWDRYEIYVRVYTIPQLGRVTLAKLGPQDLQMLYARKLEAGQSPTTVRHLHAVLHKLLAQAVGWGLVPRNVADFVSAPRMVHHEMQTLSAEQARRLLTAATGERLEALYVLALTTGMRLGELLAQRWSDVDLDGGSLQIKATLQRGAHGLSFGEPKTARSRRGIVLTEAALASLHSHRVRQSAERLFVGKEWEDNDLLFANEVGRPIDAGNLRRRSFQPLLKEAALPSIRFHDLRHTAATLLLAQGVYPKAVSEMLGHSQISMTFDLYGHVTPTMQRVAAQAMDEILTGAPADARATS